MERTGGRVASPAFVSGIVTFVFSALLTYYYLVGAMLLPLWGLLWVLARRRVRRAGTRSLRSSIGIGLHVAAILAPIASTIAWWIWINTDLQYYPDGSLRAGEPVFRFIYTPAVVVSILSVAWAWLRHAGLPQREPARPN